MRTGGPAMEYPAVDYSSLYFPADIFSDAQKNRGSEAEASTSEAHSRPIYRVAIGDNPDFVLLTRCFEDAYAAIVSAVRACHSSTHSHTHSHSHSHTHSHTHSHSHSTEQILTSIGAYGDDSNCAPSTAIPTATINTTVTANKRKDRQKGSSMQPRHSVDSYGLCAAQFFGLALPCTRLAVENLSSSIACMVAPAPHPQYRPIYRLPK